MTTRSDRILMACCAAIWLVLVGVSVAAVVALVDLGRGFHEAAGHPRTGLLYAVIGVSALIIVAAVPVLIHARKSAGVRPVAPAPIRAGYAAPHAGYQSLSADASAAGWAHQEVNQIWLRGTLSLAGAIGAAWVAVAAATYLMAVGKDGVSWAGYGVAGVITAVMPVIAWLPLRQLRQLSDG